jgi:hypothetical protein
MACFCLQDMKAMTHTRMVATMGLEEGMVVQLRCMQGMATTCRQSTLQQQLQLKEQVMMLWTRKQQPRQQQEIPSLLAISLLVMILM